MTRLAIACLLLLVASASAAVPHFADPDVRARYQSLIAQLRCVICLNQSIASSSAPLARQMRRLVADKIHAGYSNAEIKHILVERYGTFVLYEPPFAPSTWLLWLGPGLLLLMALGIAGFMLRRSRRFGREPPPVDPRRLARILEADEEPITKDRSDEAHR